ncbi:MAG: M3 family metallopeptidase [Gammaproteobacteria bacterium]|jgi:oligopeptidase A
MNILLKKHKFPPFNAIKYKDIEPALDKILTDNRAQLVKLLKNKKFTWKNLIVPIEEMDDCLDKTWSPISHLTSVMDSTELRAIYNRCLPKLVKYHTEISHNTKLYNAIKSIANSKSFKKLNKIQRRIIKREIRNFKLAGVALNKKDKEKFAVLQQQLANLTTKFSENVMDATRSWYCHITNKKLLSGLPQHIITAAKSEAKNKKVQGWVLTLDFPVYYAVMTYADNRVLRKKMYHAYVTRASDQKPSRKKFDNTEIMQEILQIKLKLSKLLGFKNFAQYSIATKMAKNTKQVMNFLTKLAERTFSYAKKEMQQLKQFARNKYKITKLEAWDISYYSEKLRKQNYAITQEELRPYFVEENALQGLFIIVEKLFGYKIKLYKNKNIWHKDVKYYEIIRNNKVVAGFYVDLYARAHKRSGAWMDECRVRRKLSNKKIQLPMAYLTCNFSKPPKNKPSLLTHDEVVTLFHEFGHCLQHLLTKVDYPEVSGINGVEWDAVELASQFMENFAWQKEGLDLIAKHYKTKKKLPRKLYKKLIASKNFHAAMQMMRQLEFALFDFRLHQEFNPQKKNQIQTILNQVRKKVSVVPTPAFNRFQHSFSHIFAGGYAAGYYSYKWAEVLSADAFAKFEETGIFNRKTGRDFLTCILEKGGSEDAMELFKKFRGRKPKIDALLKSCGLV